MILETSCALYHAALLLETPREIEGKREPHKRLLDLRFDNLDAAAAGKGSRNLLHPLRHAFRTRMRMLGNMSGTVLGPIAENPPNA